MGPRQTSPYQSQLYIVSLLLAFKIDFILQSFREFSIYCSLFFLCRFATWFTVVSLESYENNRTAMYLNTDILSEKLASSVQQRFLKLLQSWKRKHTGIFLCINACLSQHKENFTAKRHFYKVTDFSLDKSSFYFTKQNSTTKIWNVNLVTS